MQWLTDYGKARYSYAYDRALERRAWRGLPLGKQLDFTPLDSEGFDYTPWLPQNYAAAQAGR